MKLFAILMLICEWHIVDMLRTGPIKPRPLVDKLTQGLRYLTEKPLRLQYASSMAARIGWFLGQGISLTYVSVEKSDNRINVSPRNLTSPTNQTVVNAIKPLPVFGALLDGILAENGADDSETLLTAEMMKDLSVDEIQREFFGKNFASIIRVLRQDLANIESGTYKYPYDLVASINPSQWNPIPVLRKAASYAIDRNEVLERRENRNGVAVRENFISKKYPSYYLQNFHFQTDGWLSAKSASLYDYQVESLFLGTADAMRRMIIPSLAKFMKGKSPSKTKVLDVATGTGRFASFVLDNFPSLQCTVLDMSPFYLARAKETLKKHSTVMFVEGAGEDMPFPDASFDAITCVYLFHELPAPIRKKVAAEMSRVLKPGGKLFFVDSVQRGEAPVDMALDRFPVIAHEPFYNDYTKADLDALFTKEGFSVEEKSTWWVTKCITLVKGAPKGGVGLGSLSALASGAAPFPVSFIDRPELKESITGGEGF